MLGCVVFDLGNELQMADAVLRHGLRIAGDTGQEGFGLNPEQLTQFVADQSPDFSVIPLKQLGLERAPHKGA